MDTEFVTTRQWDGQALAIERANIKKYGQSLTRTGIARRAMSFIVEERTGSGGLIVKKGWRDAMKTKLVP